MIERVVYFSQHQIESLNGHKNVGLISITGAGSLLADIKQGDLWGGLLRLEFDDVTPAIVAKLGNYVLMSEKQADTILYWVHDIEIWHPEINTIFVHCAQGFSRSVAVAKFLAEERGLWTPEQHDMAHSYNTHVYELLKERYKKLKAVYTRYAEKPLNKDFYGFVSEGEGDG